MQTNETQTPSIDIQTQPASFDHYTALGAGGGVIFTIKDGDAIPAGGSVLTGNMSELYTVVDESFFASLFSKIDDSLKTIDVDKLERVLRERQAITEEHNISVKTFLTLMMLTTKLHTLYPVNHEAQSDRLNQYQFDTKTHTLSSFFTKNMAACVEYATVAQLYLQKKGISSTWMSGSLLRKKESEFAEAHTFIIVHLDDGDYIFDAARPLKGKNSYNPRILKLAQPLEKTIQERLAQGKNKTLVAAHDILLDTDAYYGIAHSNIIPERDIVE